MNRIGLVVCVLLMTACSGFGGGDDSSPATPDSLPAPSRDTPPPLEGSPSELTEDFGVFVAPQGHTDGEGSRDNPVSTITQGIALAKESGKRVYVCEGTYAESVTLADGVSVVGGVDCSTASWALGEGRSVIEAPETPAVVATGIASATLFERFEVTAPAATEPSGSSIALMATDSPGLTIARSKLVAGDGADGADGVNGVQLEKAGQSWGEPYHAYHQKCAGFPCLGVLAPDARRKGGSGACKGAPGHDGEDGGLGGSGGLYEFVWSPVALHTLPEVYNGHAAGPGETKASQPGADGQDGASATKPGAVTAAGFVPADGVAGTSGEPGKGGSGGAGYGPSGNGADGSLWAGMSGPGGGAGGCPGLAGTPGKGGGASLAMLLVRSPIVISATEIVAGAGGDGGEGTLGSSPTPGGEQGLSLPGFTPAQPGGAGGSSGFSGSGAGGSSFAIAYTGGAPQLDAASTTTVGAPGAGVASKWGVDRLGHQKTIGASVSGVAEPLHAF